MALAFWDRFISPDEASMSRSDRSLRKGGKPKGVSCSRANVLEKKAGPKTLKIKGMSDCLGLPKRHLRQGGSEIRLGVQGEEGEAPGERTGQGLMVVGGFV